MVANVFSAILWSGVIAGALAATATLILGISVPGAPQQAALAGYAACMAVVPYIVARAWDELRKL